MKILDWRTFLNMKQPTYSVLELLKLLPLQTKMKILDWRAFLNMRQPTYSVLELLKLLPLCDTLQTLLNEPDE